MLTFLLWLACAGAEKAPAPQPAAPVAESAPPPAKAAPARVAEIDVQGLARAREEGRVQVLLDVRTPGEYAAGHVPGAINVPLDDLPGRIEELELPREAPVHLICQRGGRSARAAELLAERGFQAVNVLGGTQAWIEEGLPVEKETSP